MDFCICSHYCVSPEGFIIFRTIRACNEMAHHHFLFRLFSIHSNWTASYFMQRPYLHKNSTIKYSLPVTFGKTVCCGLDLRTQNIYKVLDFLVFLIFYFLPVKRTGTFYAPGLIDFFFVSCLFVWLSVFNFNLYCYKFWTVRDRDFIFGGHTPLIVPFQMTPRSMI